jgi:hypothetical protein
MMAKHDWIADLMQTCVYDGEGRKRRVNIEKAYRLAEINGGKEAVMSLAKQQPTAGRVVMTVSNILRGAARKNRGITVPVKGGGMVFYDAPVEWLAHYGLAA